MGNGKFPYCYFWRCLRRPGTHCFKNDEQRKKG
ncbi:hypothetical protein GUB10_00110 [Salegentibacter sp. BLCTC]|nr:hypothetical protein [Salegentibacter sp. BLCTC]